MTPEETKYRRCQVPGCGYKELRGSSLGAFVRGMFVCQAHYEQRAELVKLARTAFAAPSAGEEK